MRSYTDLDTVVAVTSEGRNGRVEYRCARCTRLLTWVEDVTPGHKGMPQNLPCGKCGAINTALVGADFKQREW